MTDVQIRIIHALRNGLPATETPYDDIAREAGISVDDLLRQLREWQSDGTIRRFGAILRHRQAGFTSNVMVVWNVPPDRVEEFARVATGIRGVSHCYQRPPFEGFPYNVYTMIHGRTRAECRAAAEAIAAESGIADYKPLYTVKEYKKTSPVYFASRRGTTE